jgi:hypothetical protein
MQQQYSKGHNSKYKISYQSSDNLITYSQRHSISHDFDTLAAALFAAHVRLHVVLRSLLASLEVLEGLEPYSECVGIYMFERG